MIKLEEKDFIKGNKEDICEVLVIGEDIDEYIDSVIDKIYALDLTKAEEAQLGIDVHREKYDDSWNRVRISFGPGNEVEFSRRISTYKDKVCRVSHELTCHGQLDEDKMVSFITGFGFVGSHTLFSYSESTEDLAFDQGIEKNIRINDESNLTQYTKFGLTKKPVYIPMYGAFSYERIDRDLYKESLDENYKSVYTDLEGNKLKQEELIATSYDSFERAFTDFTDKYRYCRDKVDVRLKDIISKKILVK